MGYFSFLRQSFPLSYTKPMLLICDDERKILIMYFFLNQCMGTNNNLHFSIFNMFICETLLFCCHRPSHKFYLK